MRPSLLAFGIGIFLLLIGALAIGYGCMGGTLKRWVAIIVIAAFGAGAIMIGLGCFFDNGSLVPMYVMVIAVAVTISSLGSDRRFKQSLS